MNLFWRRRDVVLVSGDEVRDKRRRREKIGDVVMLLFVTTLFNFVVVERVVAGG